MPICNDSRRARKRARQHAAARSKAFPGLDPMAFKMFAITPEEQRAVANRGWGNENGSIRIVHAEDARVLWGAGCGGSGDWGAGGCDNGGWGVPITEDKTNAKEKDPYVWVDPTPPKTQEQLLKERVDKALVGWPWMGVPSKLVAIAPYTFNPNVQLELPMVTQTSSLFVKLFENVIITAKVCHYLFQNHDAAWKFSATCKEAWRIMRWNIDTWDMTEGLFHNCEKPRFGKDAPKDPFNQGRVAPIVMVTPVRQKQGSASYVTQVQNLHKLCLAVNNFADFFKNLQLHRIPFLTTELLELLIPKMRNLQVLSIYNCQLIHVGETMKLLDIIRIDKPLERENQVALDFFPNFHLGPVEEPGNPYSVGSYGVTWDNWNYDTTIAVWCLVLQIITKARSQKIDFESKHTMFRQWLEKGPCHKVGETIKTFMSPNSSLELIAAMVSYRRTQGKINRLVQCNRPDGTNWAIQSHKCTTCREVLMGIFFAYRNVYEKNAGLSPSLNCGGCLLKGHLRTETDHYKRKKRGIMRIWLAGPGGLNKDDLGKALADYHSRDIEGLVQLLADQRLADSTLGPDPYDREVNERQIPLTKKELSGKKGTEERSPQINETLPGNNEWEWYAQERYDGHRL